MNDNRAFVLGVFALILTAVVLLIGGAAAVDVCRQTHQPHACPCAGGRCPCPQPTPAPAPAPRRGDNFGVDTGKLRGGK